MPSGKVVSRAWTRTCDPLVKRAFEPITTSHGSYDSLRSFTGCSRFGVHLLTIIHTFLSVFTSQICHKESGRSTHSFALAAESTKRSYISFRRVLLVIESTCLL